MTHAEAPPLPWYATYLILVGLILVALVKPFMPYGIVEYALRLANRPLSLDLGQGRSLTLVEEHPLETGCAASDVHWSPDGNIVVASCPEGVQAWTLDGHSLGRSVPELSRKRMQLLAHPFRVAYIGRSKSPGISTTAFTIWNAQTGLSETLPVPFDGIGSFVADQDCGQLVIAHSYGKESELRLLPLNGGEATRTLPIASRPRTMRLLPGSQHLLLGGMDGVLSTVDIAGGDLRELASPYAISFPEGGSADGSVDGLVLAPDGKSAAIFKTGGRFKLVPGSDEFDLTAAKRWDETLGTTVQIRSVEDGRLLDRMPGQELGVTDLAWDPKDRFLAMAGRDALFLWQRQSGAIAVRTFDGPRISHSLAINNDGTRLAITTSGAIRIFRITEAASGR